ncbi:ATP-grasp domain-containing protein [Haliangium ochraceum]|uniref:RimK domain protein ATP-grasp n=1 Tax=Haliangium ochraceum (strain DSM 14365 / JCM 11303 / SMP-2) TaxID=502025 RepID=D0LTG1_HALO1|nr:hypothetical protein [Haliangium ochraceum]ACY13856.1 RimK domain protein ATP-grasp [Haliangium ochraceum DSM 14365]
MDTRKPNGAIGLWMYRNDGGASVVAQLVERLRSLGYDVVHEFDMRRCYAMDGCIYTDDGRCLSDLDVLYHMNADDQSEHQNDILRGLEFSGVRVVNDWRAYAMSRDKYVANTLLRYHDLPVPPAALLPASVSRSFVDDLCAKWQKVLVKPRGGHGAVGIQLFDDAERLWDYLLATRHLFPSFYLEKFIEFGDHDYRVEIFDGEVIGGYSRGRRHRFKTNVTGGGAMLPIPPTARREALALRAAEVFGVTATIVDMIESVDDGTTYILEVNAIMGIFVEAGMRAGTKMPITEPDPAYSNDRKKLDYLVRYLARCCDEVRQASSNS